MSKYKILLTDTVSFNYTDKSVMNIKDFYNNGNTQAIYPVIAATHSGRITKNNALYLPDKMSTGAISFIEPFPKPILLYHDSGSDPIGRAQSVRYVDTSGTVMDKYRGLVVRNSHGKEIGTINDTVIKDFVSGKMPVSMQVDTLRTIFDSFLDDDSFEGMGYIELTAKITDPDAIQKFIDGRYLTGSIGLSTDAAICSICRQDLAESGLCEHKPGRMYDRKKCYLITGNLAYSEYSMVNGPADPHSKVIQLQGNGFQDSIEIVSESTGRPYYEVSLMFDKEKNSNSEDRMDKELDTVQETEIKDAEVQAGDATATIKVEGEVTEVAEPELTDETKKVEAETEEQQGLVLDTVLEKVFADAELSEEEVLFIDEAMELGDAKLSTEKRKSLPDSSFCGPNRSFPVNDCCLTGDTEIPLLDGTKKQIKDLVGQEGFEVYSFNLKQKAIVPAKVSKVWLARKDAQTYNITLDNGEVIRATDNHPFLMKDGSYKRVDELQVGDSLMPLYRKFSSMRDGLYAYEQIYQPFYNYWEYTHHMVMRGSSGKPLGNNEHIHHINENKFDNSSSNLEQISKDEHISHHFVAGHKNNKVFDIFNKQCQKDLSYINPVTVKRPMKDYDYNNPHNEVPGTNISLLGIRNLMDQEYPTSAIAKAIGVNIHTMTRWLDIAGISSKSIKSDFRQSSIYKRAMIQNFSEVTRCDFGKVLKDLGNGKNLTEVSEECGIYRDTIKSWAKRLDVKLPSTSKSSTSSRNIVARNHQIVSIELGNIEDVYDIEVPGTNNFALEAGVFVHNSHYTAAKRLISRYKGPGDKSKIMACIERKGKVLGCGSATKKEDSVENTEPLQGTVIRFSDFELKTITFIDEISALDKNETEIHYDSAVSLLNKLNEVMTPEVLKKVLIDSGLSISQDQIDTLEGIILEREETIEELVDTISDKTETIDALRKEYTSLYKETEQVRSELIDSILQNRKSREEIYFTLAKLSDSVNSNFVIEDADVSSLDTEIQRLSDSVDLEKFSTKLNDGTSNVPEVTVEDPTKVILEDADKVKNIEDSAKDNVPISENPRKEIAQINQTYLQRRERNSRAADMWLDSMQPRLSELRMLLDNENKDNE